MADYEFDCINYADESDKEMCPEWRSMRKVFHAGGVGEWTYTRDEERIGRARGAYEEVKRLAKSQLGKASLLVDGELGFCMIYLENPYSVSAHDASERERLVTLLGGADSITFTRGMDDGVCMKLGYKAFCKAGET